MRRFFICISAAILICGCAGNRREVAGGQQAVAYTFKVPVPPSLLDESGRINYLRAHFWDDFDFDDPAVITRLDSTAFRTQYLNYLSILSVSKAEGAESMAALMEKASASESMFSFFSDIAKAFLYDPNSPLRDDELYLPVLQARSESPYLDASAQASAAVLAELALRNRVGEAAEDFNYITMQGRLGSLYGIKTDYTLVYFNNPGCHMCREVSDAMKASERITYMVRNSRLTILGLYPDDDIELWKSYKDDIPSEWINARDPGSIIQETDLYDLKAIPSLYLLDRDKKVLLKDCTDVREIEAVLSRLQ